MINWTSTTLGNLASYINGRGFKPTEWTTQGLPIVRIANLNNPLAPYDYFSGDIDVGHCLENGDILVSWSASLDVFVWTRGPAALNQHIFKVIPNENVVDRTFLFFVLKQALQGLSELVHGATMKHVTRPEFEGFVVQIPSNKENQRRIAARLKSQLAEVEKARQAAELQLMETVKLTDAVNKTLENEIFANAEIQLFGSYVISYRNGFGKRPKEGETGSIVLRIADVSNGIISTANPRYGEVSAKEAETYKLEVGDLIFIRVNGSKEIVGRCCVVNTNIPDGTIFNDHLIRVQITHELDPDFARLCVSLPKARKIIEEAASTSAGQLTINQQLLDRLEIPVYSFDNQKKIVEKLQKQLNQLAILREAALNCITDINSLPQKILAQAFGS